jgi:hypothetical protein
VELRAATEWQTAMECLILVAEKNGPTMMARIGVMRALNRSLRRRGRLRDRRQLLQGDWPHAARCRFPSAVI